MNPLADDELTRLFATLREATAAEPPRSLWHRLVLTVEERAERPWLRMLLAASASVAAVPLLLLFAPVLAAFAVTLAWLAPAGALAWALLAERD